MSTDAERDPDDPLSRNRLDEEASPYLRQHADNPVNWQPWDEAALGAARETDRPIFLSIGYSACHWCHVMEEESFADGAVAEVLNEHFVPIKVDREERPDVDSVYMTVCQLVTGRGGWPLSAFLTPDGRPFYVGTYFPRDPKGNTPGFLDLCERIADSWNDPEQRGEMENRADQWTAAAEDELEGTPTPDDEAREPPDAGLLDSAASSALRAADREYGGFGRSGPKFPNPGRLHLLLRAHDRAGREDYREVVDETLTAMANGGMYDHLGGGFHRYATDRSWTVPHFEKMLYDQATLAPAYLEGYQVTGEERYAEVARETFAFVEREMQHPGGGFFSTLDAQSEDPETGEREEGAFFVWTPADVETAIEDDLDADLFRDRFGVTRSGNFEGGKTVLTRAEPVESLADEHGIDESTVRERLERAVEWATEYRETRPRPARDEKVLAGWNGLMISAFAEGALVLDTDLAGTGERALSFVRERLWNPGERRLTRRWKDGDAKVTGYLEDYAFLGRGALDLYQATGEVEHLAFAMALARTVTEEFWDAEAGTLYFTPESGESLVARPQELGDRSTPSSTGVAASLLLDLAHFDPGDRFREVAEGVLDTHAKTVETDPLQHATLALAADTRAVGSLELTVAADSLPGPWRGRLAETYLPDRLLTVRPPTEAGLDEWLEALGLDEAPPIWAGREARDGPTLYACRSFTCSPPTDDVEEALEWAERLAPGGGDGNGPDPDVTSEGDGPGPF
ncbi:thioredoxin domain-containing protein [Halobacteriales archaeon QS_5_70_15]|nr:MAG: thioredoxin domain-containing protein [Halobacteriales archaeon QS_5_70_15]